MHPFFPEQPVSVGDTWTETFQAGLEPPLLLRLYDYSGTFKREGISRLKVLRGDRSELTHPLALISFRYEGSGVRAVDFHLAQAIPRPIGTKIEQRVLTPGELYLDIESGVILRQETETRLKEVTRLEGEILDTEEHEYKTSRHVLGVGLATDVLSGPYRTFLHPDKTPPPAPARPRGGRPVIPRAEGEQNPSLDFTAIRELHLVLRLS
jgi:hypothetical protein